MPVGSILISGIGIAGPTLAYWLAESGFTVTLVERAPQPRSGGYIIDFWGRGYDIAERMGLAPALRREGYDVQALRFVDARGRRVGGFDAEVFRSLTDGRYVSLPRGALATMIYRTLGERCECLFDDSITAVAQDRDGVDVSFAHAPVGRFDAVVGADGLHSVVRTLAFGGEGNFERDLGYTVAAFEAKGYRPRDDGIYVSYAVPGKQVARFAMRDDRTVFLLVFATPRDQPDVMREDADHRAVLHREFGQAGWECPAILAAMDRCDELYCDRVSQIRIEAWSRGRMALVGDAAYCPSLLAGQGSALAMIGAYVLAGELAARPENPAEAFRRYEQRMRPFILEKQDGAEQFAGSFAPRTRFGLFVRNQVSKAFALPAVAKFVLRKSLLDRIELPDYGGVTPR
jgi:2-polyprenyl-6-methoxyphenol hydroxylase-like FAD-dependent oxidoreductase